MIQTKHIKKLLVAFTLIMGFQVALASISFTGIVDDKNKGNKYSLKNLSLLSHRGLSLTTIKLGFQFKGSDILNQKNTLSGSEVNSILRFDRGNTTYIIPYKFKSKVPMPKFKAPTAQIN